MFEDSRPYSLNIILLIGYYTHSVSGTYLLCNFQTIDYPDRQALFIVPLYR